MPSVGEAERRRHDTQHNDIQRNDTSWLCRVSLGRMSFVLSVTIKYIKLNVIMLSREALLKGKAQYG
jgi:hypothetical protein